MDPLVDVARQVIELEDNPLAQFRRENRYYPVIGQGNNQAEIMVIGEAPGENEAKRGLPFCGAAGKVLDELFLAINLAREDIYVTNLIKDRPPENRDPTPEEIEIYAPFLDRQIACITPRVVLTLGRFSSHYCMKRYSLAESVEPISRLHARVFETTIEGQSVALVPFFHPAVALYNGSKRGQLKEDIKILSQFIS